MSIRPLRAGLSGLVMALIPIGQGSAHEIVGNRFFPATLGIDDPGVNDELSLPTVDSFKTGDDPPVRQRDISGEFSKRITADFAVSFGSTYSFLGPTDPTAAGANGFQNLDTTFKYRVFRNAEHEFVMSVGLSVEWGGTGAASIGVIGGSGFYALLDRGEEVSVDTPFGPPSDVIVTGEVAGRRVAFLPRHGRDHRFPPHKIPYRANLWALRSLGGDVDFGRTALGDIIGPAVAADEIVEAVDALVATYLERRDAGERSVSARCWRPVRSAR